MEDDRKIDLKIPVFPGTSPDAVQESVPTHSPEPIPAIQQWRDALQQMPEWDNLPDDLAPEILHRLRKTPFPPSEPSGHAAWKQVKCALQQGSQPDWVSLITAVFVWRVKRKRPDNQMSNALPDVFVQEAGYHTPPIDIHTWPTKGMTADQWKPKHEPIPLSAVKDEIPAPNGQFAGPWIPQLPIHRAATEAPAGPSIAHLLARQQSMAPEFFQSAPSPLGPISGNAAPKRTLPSDFNTPSPPPVPRPTKRARTSTSTRPRATPNLNNDNALQVNFANQLAEMERRIIHLTRDHDDTKNGLAETKQKLYATTRELDDAKTEVSELRATVNSNRRYITRITKNLATDARERENAASKNRRDYEEILEKM